MIVIIAGIVTIALAIIWHLEMCARRTHKRKLREQMHEYDDALVQAEHDRLNEREEKLDAKEQEIETKRTYLEAERDNLQMQKQYR